MLTLLPPFQELASTGGEYMLRLPVTNTETDTTTYVQTFVKACTMYQSGQQGTLSNARSL